MTVPACIVWVVWIERNQRWFEEKTTAIQYLNFTCLSLLGQSCKSIVVNCEDSMLELTEMTENRPL